MSDRRCPRCSYLASLRRDQCGVVADVLQGVLLAGAVNAMGRTARLRAMAPPIDIEAERIVLGAALRTGAPLIPELFGDEFHYALAVAITTGQLAPELLYPEAVGYRRGLRRARCGSIELHAAVDTLFALRAQRMPSQPRSGRSPRCATWRERPAAWWSSGRHWRLLRNANLNSR